MSLRVLSIIGLLALSQVSTVAPSYAQATLELGEVNTQPVAPGTAANTSANASATKPVTGTAPVPHRETPPGRPASGASPSTGTGKGISVKQGSARDSQANAKPERLEFKRRPLRITLGSAERLVTFPHPVAISLPAGAEASIEMQIIGRTAYFSMLAPRSAPVRVLAEDLVTGQTIPLDLLGAEGMDGLSPEVEVHYEAEARAEQPQGEPSDEPSPVLDLVQLTRYAAQTVYAPRRLKPAADGVSTIPMDSKNIEGLFRGARTRGRPLGQWRSGDLYVTAVQVVNLEKRAVLLDLEQVRGQWIAATLQHHHLQPAGADLDNTTLYLVCGQPFHACR